MPDNSSKSKWIIADSNIWYDVGNKNISLDLIKSLPVAVTALTIAEMLTSPKLQNNSDQSLVLGACRAIINSNARIIPYLPYEFVAREYLSKKIKQKLSISEFQKIAKLGFDELDIVTLTTNRHSRVTSFRESLKLQIEKVKEDPSLIEQIKNSNEATKISAIDFINEIGQILNINSLKVNQEKIMRIGNGLDLYLRARARFIQKLSLKNEKPAGNDQVDLTNLLYVMDDNLYWTRDKKWLGIIMDVGKGDKLFINEIGTKVIIDQVISKIQ